ncbi:hypothetical protein D3P07_11250 [Paenibacillus sp. 1011MAR3C5]|uniref:FxLYD domain-containing protein n=1 Tax=Paenibacillus sp. 1011MAR3C5 TaxID=1675787 RepID=UPI000E6B8312|nr:FxLYD domain-containing protein [Paenibacillus sp. 1011MAR3C5]RJE88564.1 hypothetical protein D3P07_11250 [Paenibacillus sp. 1011MAR3C5]
MYCHHCVRSYAEDARYCSQCGRRLHSHRIIETANWEEALSEGAASLELAGEVVITGRSMPNAVQGKRGLGWPIPLALAGLAFVVTMAVILYYQYEKGVNETVLRLQSEARTAALSGEYIVALEKLEDALEARPAFKALAADVEIIQHVLELERMTEQIETRLSVGMIDEAESGLNRLKTEFGGHKEPIYDKLREKLDELNMKLTLQKLTKEYEALTTVKELGEMLNVVNGLIGEEAAELRQQIIVSIQDITAREVDQLLARKNFTGATAAVNRSLAWAREDKELLALLNKIKEEQSRYERLEQQRIEQAMQRAAEEDLINRTSAVEVVSVEKTLDEFGDLTIEGTLKNIATRAIYSVVVEVIVQSKDGAVLSRGKATVTPEYIEAGEQMTFTTTVYGIYSDETTVVVDKAEWYLD